ncbi:hypothetical protein DFH09DRAFT_1409553 [Mycena vulgaris]|nr:hypothetical protein DFH09DRAFT_1409553 [Mycena vulgaris]
MSLDSMSEDLIILVCLELSVADISSLRQVCRALHGATGAKVLWLNVLEQEVNQKAHILPPYLKTYDLLDAVSIQALVRRILTLARKWETRDLSPANAWRLHLPLSITWIRLVAGSWLFVASSDNQTSKLSCWDLSLVFRGHTKPLAEAYLPGQVKTGKLEIQDCGVVMALGLGAESRSVHIITLRRQRSDSHYFAELSRIDNSSHVLMLSGDFVGCALRNDTIEPHIINWKENRIYDIPPPPDGLDIPGRRSVPHLMTIWGERLVILRRDALEIYTLSLTTGDSILFLKLLTTPTIWEAAVCEPESMSSTHTPPLRLVVISPLGIEMCFIGYNTLAVLDEYRGCPTFRLARSPYYAAYQDSWYSVCVGQTSRRMLWMSAPPEDWMVGGDPHFNYMDIPLLPLDTKRPPIAWSDVGPDRPALWAVPVVDFDDALGLTIIGNCFGELSIYDHGGSHPELCAGLAVDFMDQPSPIPPLLPSMPISLGLLVAPPAKSSLSDWTPIVSQWSQDDIDLGEPWKTDWLSGGYGNWDQWQGALTDFAWYIEHQYGFPGPAIPQAYADDVNNNCQHLLFRAGDRYFVFTPGQTPALRSWPRVPPPRHFLVTEAQPEYPTRRTAITEADLYNSILRREMWVGIGRHRWTEQAERRST